jgi:hypothetical protein
MVNTKWNLTGVHGLNKFLWAKMQSELEWSSNNYGGLVPILPAGQQPELNDYAAPYVVYTQTHQNAYENWWLQREQITYSVYSMNESDIRQFINLVREYLMREDESASIVNSWIWQNGSTENKRFDYKNFEVVTSLSAQPPISEGGRMDGAVVVRMQYTYYDPTDGRKDRLTL